MKYFLVFILGLSGATVAYCQENDAARDTKQAELDSLCEEVRQKALAPMRRELFQECLEKKGDTGLCEQEAAAYDGARAHRGPMFYDLPECVAAFDYRKGDGAAE